jgi:hypothetical protein
MRRTGSLKNRGRCASQHLPASLLITRFLLHTFSFLHKFNQAVWPHIGPIFIYERKASGMVV